MSGFVVLGGLFEPGTSVSLYAAADGVLRPEAGVPAGRRLADSGGTVGFDGLLVGGRFLAVGFDVYGQRARVTCRAQGEGGGSDVAQSPVRPDVRQPLGTGEVRPAPVVAGVPGAVLHTGVPAGVPASVAQAAA